MRGLRQPLVTIVLEDLRMVNENRSEQIGGIETSGRHENIATLNENENRPEYISRIISARSAGVSVVPMAGSWK
jgi:hypothetical protein